LSGPPRRTKSISAPKKRILVFTEGEATEPIYLNYWYRLHRERVVVVIDDRHGAPMTLVTASIAERKHQLAETKRGRGTGFDEYWCIFDVDEHPHLEQALSLAEENEVRIALSNPCIELWFVLHKQDQTAFVERSVIQHRSKALFGFSKRPPQDVLDSLQPFYPAAKARSEALARIHEGNGSPSRSNPSCSIAALIESVISGSFS
jgi:RloB-like protein